MKRNVLGEYGIAWPWLASGLAALLGAAWLRYGVLEAGVFPLDCGLTLAESEGTLCIAKWMLVQSFLHQRLGWVCLVAGIAAFVLQKRPLAWIGWLTGIVGLVLYNFDYAAIGGLLSLLVLVARPQQMRSAQPQASH